MKSKICEQLGCEFPLFAFSHCRDVVVEVSKAGALCAGSGWTYPRVTRDRAELDR